MRLQYITSPPAFGDPRLPARFWDKVRILDSGCWGWVGSTSERGYGYFRWQGKPRRAHRVAYEALMGPIEKGLESDHLCRVRHCVNPVHIEPVSHRLNILRGGNYRREKTECPQGHPFNGANTYVYKDKHGYRGRHCRICRQAAKRRFAAKVSSSAVSSTQARWHIRFLLS